MKKVYYRSLNNLFCGSGRLRDANTPIPLANSLLTFEKVRFSD